MKWEEVLFKTARNLSFAAIAGFTGCYVLCFMQYSSSDFILDLNLNIWCQSVFWGSLALALIAMACEISRTLVFAGPRGRKSQKILFGGEIRQLSTKLEDILKTRNREG